MSLLTSPSQRAANRSRSVGDAVRLLADGGCPICRNDRERQRRWIASYVHETNADAEVTAELKTARGFCAAHLRLLVTRTDASFVLPASLGDAVDGRLQELAASTAGPAPGEHCPPCLAGQRAAVDSIGALAAVGSDPAVQAALADKAAVCLRHTIMLVGATRSATALHAFADRFAEVSGTAALTPMTGDDPDADARARLLPALLERDDAVVEAVRRPALAQAIDAVRQPSCPTCRASGLSVVSYLRWLTDARQDLDRTPDPVQTALCPTHLHDLSTLDPLTASWIADLQHPVVATRLERLAAGMSSGRRQIGQALSRYAGSIRPCPACRAANVADERWQALFAAALPDAAFRRAAADAHGWCVSHAPALGPAGLPVEVLRARLEVLGWELAESRRKREWWTRHERLGVEMGAWRRAPTLLAGDTYLGLEPDAYRS